MNDSEAMVRQILAARPDEAVLLIAGTDLREVLRLLDEARADLARVTAERDCLAAGGCARDQRSTQFCAEAVALAARLQRCEALLRELLDAGKHHDCLPLRGNCDRCVAEDAARDYFAEERP